MHLCRHVYICIFCMYIPILVLILKTLLLCDCKIGKTGEQYNGQPRRFGKYSTDSWVLASISVQIFNLKPCPSYMYCHPSHYKYLLKVK